jgi:hypothetical protein
MARIGISGHRGLSSQAQKLVDAALREVRVHAACFGMGRYGWTG